MQKMLKTCSNESVKQHCLGSNRFRAGFMVKLCFSLLSDLMDLEILWSLFISVCLQFQ